MGFWRTLFGLLDAGGPLRAGTEEERQARERRIVDKLARETARLGLGAVGIFVAEASKPLGRVGATALDLFSPSVGQLLGERRMANLACLLEDSANLERFARALEKSEEKRGWK